jgi:predicted ester cyclase
MKKAMPAITPPLDANVSLVTGFMQAVWGDANSELIDHYVGAGFVDHAYTPHDSSGHANMVRVFSAAFSGAAHRLEQCVAQGDMVMLQLRVQARHSGQFRDIAATGKAIDVTQYRTFGLPTAASSSIGRCSIPPACCGNCSRNWWWLAPAR